MWKAIINWINSKAYRCEHNYELIKEIDVVTPGYQYPLQTKWIYRCTKCCDSKIIRS